MSYWWWWMLVAQSPEPDWAERIRQKMEQSVDRQRESARAQWVSIHGKAESPPASFFTTPWPARTPPTPASSAPATARFFCDPIPAPTLAPLMDSAAGRHGLPAGLIDAVVRQESARYPCAVSPAGALGLMQLMPETAAALGVRNPFDPAENIDGGARFLKSMIDRFGGDLKLALGAYNAGPGAVEAHRGVPPYRETQNYVREVLARIKPVEPVQPVLADSP